ncbi:MAG: hypothetical protein E6J52_07090 [Chloroflexi bacterium]|nr:MAG: hypothetical protein E6J52_07090 [Chloroflexota bacterium]TMC31369.1 MAG: hypothetical protein E6J27_00395 [Chloroflexota bacterium]TMC57460.1 MAG: hypothetical protein E6J19_05845 [Chloroflexota bacterium]
MLARLLEEPGVQNAESDVHGELMRVRFTDEGDPQHVLDLLDDLGFAATFTGEVAGEREWYDVGHVAELSRAEGRIIAARVVLPFARDWDLDDDMSARLVDEIARALYECFIDQERTTNRSAAAFRTDCETAVVRVVAPLLGEDRAAALGKAVATDLAQRSTANERVEGST